MWAAPLYMEQGPGNKGAFIVVTMSNNVYAIDETTGMTVWMHNIGTPPNTGFAGCGNDTGITSTPVIDAASRTIFVAGVVNNGGVKHEIHALSADTGMEKAG
jgi:outer membrane protein assembly factor BamB